MWKCEARDFASLSETRYSSTEKCAKRIFADDLLFWTRDTSPDSTLQMVFGSKSRLEGSNRSSDSVSIETASASSSTVSTRREATSQVRAACASCLYCSSMLSKIRSYVSSRVLGSVLSVFLTVPGLKHFRSESS